MLNFQLVVSTWIVFQCFQCILLLKTHTYKKIIIFFFFASYFLLFFYLCERWCACVYMCRSVHVCVCMCTRGFLHTYMCILRVGEKRFKKWTYQWVFSCLTPVSQHILLSPDPFHCARPPTDDPLASACSATLTIANFWEHLLPILLGNFI